MADRFHNIVVGIDFSPFCKTALSQALRLAGRDGASLHVVHVMDSLVLDDLRQALRDDTDQFEQEVRDQTRERLDEFIHETAQGEPAVEISVLVGNPLLELLRLSRDVSVDLLVLGAHGSSNFDERTGSLVSKCVRKASTRVMVVRATHAESFKKIVVCIDFSESSARAVELAFAMARRDHARLDVLHVFYPPWARLHYRAPTRESSPEFRLEYSQALEGHLDGFIEKIAEESDEVIAERHLVESMHTGSGITEFLKDRKADLAVVGTKGRSALKVFLMGTTAEQVVAESPCSVLTVKPADFVFDID